MAVFQPPPTWAEPILVDEKTGKSKFNPVWLKWFLDVVAVLNASGGGSGSIQHNSTGGLQGGTANQFYHMTAAEDALLALVTSNVWTPTLDNTTNVAASTAYDGQYIRVGNRVIASGRVDVDPTAAAATELGISLPVASNFGALEDCAGVAFCPAVAGEGAAVSADAANNRAKMNWIATDTANRAFYFIFLYDVI